ncbi:MAG: cytochrome c [Hyphomonadaceae bacterium]|nr:MAG: cytochrome c [Hyphomonadaceae bacterium]
MALGACSPKPAATNEVASTSSATQTATNAVETTAPAAPVAPAAPAATFPTAEDTAKLASLPAPYNQADLANGKRQFAVCKACHTLPSGGPNMVGPNLHKVVGRHSGSIPSFAYSDGLKSAGFSWDYAKLDAYLTNPKAVIADSRMAYAGMPVANNRRDVIAYLKIESEK